jgi:competence protein ComEC
VPITTALRAIHDHPRHAILFAATAGLLLGPLSQAATLVAAVAAAATTAAASFTAARPVRSARAGSLRADPQAGPLLAPDLSAGSPLAPDLPVAATLGIRDRSRGRVAGIGGPAVALSIAVAGAVLLGALVAELRIGALEGGSLPALLGRPLTGRAVVLEPFHERTGGPAVARARFQGAASEGAVVEDETAVLRVRPEAHPGAWPEIGEIVEVSGTVAALGRYDAYQRRRGAAAAVDVAQLRATGARRGGLAGAVDVVRRRAEAGLSQGLPPPREALLRGMVLGQDEQLSDETRDQFKRSGLAHTLAVSGQNVMLLATLVLAAGAVIGVGLRARLLLALALVALYVPLTGAGPSIQRAGVMGAAGLVAALAGRPAHRFYALGLAAAVTLAVNPRAAGEPGWQLSFAAVVSLLALAPGLRDAFAHALPGPVADVAAITASATIGTAPLMALHFGQVSLAALPANLLAAAAIAPIMWLGTLAAAAAQIAPALAVPFNTANAPLLAFVDWTARTFAAAPMAVLPARIASPAALVVVYAAVAGAILTARGLWRRVTRDGLTWRRATHDGVSWRLVTNARIGRAGSRAAPPLPALVAGVAVVAVFVLLIVASPTGGGAPPAPGELVVSFLDIGQGDATLIQRDGAAVLVDTGPPDGPIVRRLTDAGVTRLDALVLTHAQADHEGAALTVLRAFPTRLVVDGGAGWPTAVQHALPAAAAAAHARRIDAHAGQVLTFGAFRMRFLWPPPPGPDFRPEGDPNDRAIVAHVESGDFDLLLPADAESNVTAPLDLPQVEALKVAHHGSADEGLPDLLERTDPEFAAIEVGRGNTYGHPAPSTLAALRVVPQVFRTDRDGTIRLRVRGEEMRVERSGWFR